MQKNSRIAGLDLVRCVALIMVFTLHAFAWLGYYNAPVSHFVGYASMGLRNLCMSAVPLFLLLSGFLKKRKKANLAHYRTIIPILISMVMATGVLCAYVSVRDHVIPSVTAWAAALLNYSEGYNWYIEMYVGLFLLMPLLNACWNADQSEKWHQTILATCIVLTVLPTLLNGYNIRGVSFDFVPDWWTGHYPVVYYFIGAYIGEHTLKISKKMLLAFLTMEIVITMLRPSFYSEEHRPGQWEDYADWSFVLISTTVFLILYDIKIANGTMNKAVHTIADRSLDMYLISVVFDNLIYRAIQPELKEFPAALLLLPFTVLAVFGCSFLYAWLKKQVEQWTSRLFPVIGDVISRA